MWLPRARLLYCWISKKLEKDKYITEDFSKLLLVNYDFSRGKYTMYVVLLHNPRASNSREKSLGNRYILMSLRHIWKSLTICEDNLPKEEEEEVKDTVIYC